MHHDQRSLPLAKGLFWGNFISAKRHENDKIPLNLVTLCVENVLTALHKCMHSDFQLEVYPMYIITNYMQVMNLNRHGY